MTRSTRQGVLLILTLLVLGALLALAPLTNISFWAIDLYTFRAAAKALMLGADPYHTPNIPQFADGATVGNIHDYLYAPYFAVALRPLAWLPPEAASRVWFALNLLLFFVSIGLLLIILRWRPVPASFLVLIGGLVLFPPLRTTLVIGQSTVLLLFFLALSLFLLRRGQPFWGGLAFSLGLFKPHLFPLLLFFLLYRRWRWLSGAALGLLLLNLPLLGWLDNWVAGALATRSANLAVDQCFQMVSLVSLLNCTFFWPDWVWLLLAGGLSVALFGLVWLTTRPPAGDPQAADRAFERRLALFITLIVLLIDHTRIADQMLLVFPLLVIWRDWSHLTTPLARRIALFLVGLIYMLPYSLDFLGGRNIAFLLPFWYIGLSGAILCLLLLEWRTYGQQIGR